MCLAFASWTAGPGGRKAAWGLFPSRRKGHDLFSGVSALLRPLGTLLNEHLFLGNSRQLASPPLLGSLSPGGQGPTSWKSPAVAGVRKVWEGEGSGTPWALQGGLLALDRKSTGQKKDSLRV